MGSQQSTCTTVPSAPPLSAETVWSLLVLAELVRQLASAMHAMLAALGSPHTEVALFSEEVLYCCHCFPSHDSNMPAGLFLLWSVAQLFPTVLNSVIPEVLSTALMGLALAGSGCILELAGIGSIKHGGS